jgi:hypothetical protein
MGLYTNANRKPPVSWYNLALEPILPPSAAHDLMRQKKGLATCVHFAAASKLRLPY